MPMNEKSAPAMNFTESMREQMNRSSALAWRVAALVEHLIGTQPECGSSSDQEKPDSEFERLLDQSHRTIDSVERAQNALSRLEHYIGLRDEQSVGDVARSIGAANSAHRVSF